MNIVITTENEMKHNCQIRMKFDFLVTFTFVEDANVGVALPEPPGVFIMPLSPPC